MQTSSSQLLIVVSIFQLTTGLWTPEVDTLQVEVAPNAEDRPFHWELSSRNSRVALVESDEVIDGNKTLRSHLKKKNDSRNRSILADLGLKAELPKSIQAPDVVYLVLLLSAIVMMVAVGDQTVNAEGQLEKHLFPRSMPAIASIKYICIIVFWINHKWLGFRVFHTSRMLLMLSGFVLQFAEERRSTTNQSDSWSTYYNFLVRRVTKLYPLFALAVLVADLKNSFHATCKPISNFLIFPALVQNAECSFGDWFIPVIIACYMVFPVLSAQLRKIRFRMTCALVCLCFIVVRVSYSKSLSLNRKTFPICLSNFLMGMALARLWTFLANFKQYHRFCEFACVCSPLALLLVRAGPDWMLGGPSERPWVIFWQCVLLLAFAGPCESSDKMGFNPPLKLLSWDRLAWMGELALPLYMTNPMAVSFVRHLFADHGYHHLMIWQCWLAEFIFMHLMAYMFYTFCATTLASKAAARPPELRPAVSNAPQSLPAAANVSSSEQV